MTDTARKTAKDFDPAVMQLFDQYVHGLIDRRGFLKGTSALAISAAAATGMLAALTPDFAAAQQVKPDDARLKAEFLEFDSPAGYGKGRGYLVRPADATAPLPLVLVVHENRGLNPHIEDITRRLALAGYLAFAPDALFPLGGYPGDEDSARTLFQQLDQARTREDMVAAAGFLAGLEGGNGRMGAIGFCYGGAIANFLATRLPELKASVPFYGSGAPLADVGKIKAELLVVLAADDERVNAGWPAYEEALKAAGVTYRMIQPPDTLHGFNNDTTPRYNEGAAAVAWSEALALFERTLRG
ncbi:MAG: dienelactone hydrolase family protein [Arenimonas sp.]|uniref:dienelactone hydrolase family protein n=1 Tax=Arenimonas sp. TaxID=1872635 RepID=UPI0025B8F9F7|nr:dienelactone hydrolase family protein [Arenimonas sp.]MBW8368658.1 dienelactone hydrolase family protein [Arenimonas sp.]